MVMSKKCNDQLTRDKLTITTHDVIKNQFRTARTITTSTIHNKCMFLMTLLRNI